MLGLQRRLGHMWRRVGLLELALCHRSWQGQGRDRDSNERLEFLGDAVLDLVVADHLFRHYPLLAEGPLSQIRAALVCADALYRAAVRVGLGAYIRIGVGQDHLRTSPSVLSDAMEAVIGSAYTDSGMPAACRVIDSCSLIPREWRAVFSLPGVSFKTR